MQPPRRQIIKTRSQRPYIFARVILVIVALIVLVLAAWFLSRQHPAHATAPWRGRIYSTERGRSTILQEALLAERMPQIQPTMERRRS